MLLSRIISLIVLSSYSLVSVAETAAAPSTTMSVLKMILGLVVVLGVMAFFAWGAKRYLPGVANQPSVIRVVGGASVGSRERVVVLEVAGRWLVVGVASGQVTQIANLEPSNISALTDASAGGAVQGVMAQDPLQPFTNWLKKSMQKFPQK